MIGFEVHCGYYLRAASTEPNSILLEATIRERPLSSKVMIVVAHREYIGRHLSKASPAGYKRFSKSFGGSSAASSTTNYGSPSFTNGDGVAVTYFDPKTARGVVVLSIVGGA